MLKKLLLTGAAASGLLFAGAAQAAPILTVDTFDDALTGGTLSVAAFTTVMDLSTGSGILDGDRELIISHTGPLATSPDIFAQVTGGMFTHNNGATATGTSLLRWDGSGNAVATLDFDLNGGAGYDLSAGNLAVHIIVVDADLTGSSITLTMYNDGANYGSAVVVLPNGPSDHLLALTSLTATGSFSLANITAIELFANGGPSFDVAIDIIEVVPEPLTIGLFGLGLVGAGALRRRIKA